MAKIPVLNTFVPNTTIESSKVNANNASIRNAYNAHDSASSGEHGVTGNVVGTTDTQVLTNKSIGGLGLGSAELVYENSANDRVYTIPDTGSDGSVVVSSVIQDYTIIGGIGATNQIFAGHIFELDEGGTDVALYLFEDSGSLTTDTSGNGYTLTNVGSASATNGITNSGYATRLNGSSRAYYSNSLLNTFDSSTSSDLYIIDCWVRPNDGNPADVQVIWSRYDGTSMMYLSLETSGALYIYIKTNSGDSEITCKTQISSKLSNVYINDYINITVGICPLVAGVVEVECCVNSQFMGRTNVVVQYIPDLVNGKFSIGASWSGAAHSNWFDGDIGMLRVRNMGSVSSINQMISIVQLESEKSFGTKYNIPSQLSNKDFEVVALIKNNNEDQRVRSINTTNYSLYNELDGYPIGGMYLFNTPSSNDYTRKKSIEACRTSSHLYINGAISNPNEYLKLVIK